MTNPAQNDAIDFFEPGTDPSLAQLVEMINAVGEGATAGVTLTTSGAIVTGTIVSGRTYFEGLNSTLEAAGKDSNEWPGVTFAVFAQTYRDREGGTRNADSAREDQPGPSYIHLNNAAIIPNGMSRIDLGSWRGKLSSVDGWTLGLIQPKETQRD
ncbi:hypothetical protein [Rhodococcoides fascians]|uniref:hypothetical protein n=1 Tax=Rhodococcoides fascians TaxID=1828 RepID=UPI00278696C4|nr:hypothetical protein [Rhodococcus fascians]MDQ0283740.1 hypothetical protein [Rhodococcus fascians]